MATRNDSDGNPMRCADVITTVHWYAFPIKQQMEERILLTQEATEYGLGGTSEEQAPWQVETFQKVSRVTGLIKCESADASSFSWPSCVSIWRAICSSSLPCK